MSSSQDITSTFVGVIDGPADAAYHAVVRLDPMHSRLRVVGGAAGTLRQRCLPAVQS
jgi:hypothetical protein